MPAHTRYRLSLAAFRLRHLAGRAFRFLSRKAAPFRKRPGPSLSPHDKLVAIAARTAALTVDELPYGFLRIRKGGRTLYSKDFDFSFENLTAYWLCGNKHLTSMLLREADVPVPDLAIVDRRDFAAALVALNTLGPPVVVKPCFGAAGNGVTVGVHDARQLRVACCNAGVFSDKIIIERLAAGSHWRITVFDGDLLFACERLPASVVGDGRCSVRQLIHNRNRSLSERDGFPTGYPIKPDSDLHAALRAQSMSLEAIPAAGTHVVLKRICNAAAGGSTADVTAELHPDFLNLARKAAATMGARLAGVDVIAPDARHPMVSGSVFVNEVNTTPDLMLPHFDISGRGDAVAVVRRLLEMAFASEQIRSRRIA